MLRSVWPRSLRLECLTSTRRCSGAARLLHSARVRLDASAPGSGSGLPPPGLILGCGSNVVDTFMHVKRMPGAGQKGYFASPTQVESARIVGGVTLNHLAWASALGAPTGLLALQGEDAAGLQIREAMGEQGVSAAHVHVSPELASSVSMIFLQEDGERCIVMAPAATALIDSKAVETHFASAVREHASMLSTEISQVPLSGVQALLEVAKSRKLLTLVDVDVPPSVAVGEAGLGDMEALMRTLHLADVVKPTLESAREVIAMLDPSYKPVDEPLTAVAQRLLDLLPSARMVALTDGSRGAALVVSGGLSALIPCFPVSEVRDTTGAGDAFFGGLLAGLWLHGIPRSSDALARVGQLAAAAGSVCVQVLGALPEPRGKSSEAILRLVPGAKEAFELRRRQMNMQGGTVSKRSAAPTPTKSAAAQASSTSDDDAPLLAALQSSLDADASTLSSLRSSTHLADVASAVRALLAAADSDAPSRRHIFVTGVGKSGLVGARLASSLSSLGVAAQFVHATEWLHGDLGRIRSAASGAEEGESQGQGDLIIALSHSGSTPELVALLPHFKERGVQLMLISGGAADAPAPLRAAAGPLHLSAPVAAGAEPFGVVPSCSVVAQEAVCNMLVRGCIAAKRMNKGHFTRNHPGGAIGHATAKRQ